MSDLLATKPLDLLMAEAQDESGTGLRRVLGPAAAPIMRLKRDYRYHFVLKSPSREKLNTTLRAMLAYAAQQKIPRTQVIVDVDALWLM